MYKKTIVAMIIILILSSGNPSIIFAQSSTQQILFSDDFEKGLQEPWVSDEGWSVIKVNGNNVLQGTEHSFIRLLADEDLGDIESLECKFELQSSSFHINYRTNSYGSRYFISLSNGVISLNKSVQKQPVPSEGDPFNHIELTSKPISISNKEWHSVRILGTGNRIQIYLDDILQIDFMDEQDPYLTGSISFEAMGDGNVLIDNVVLQGQLPTSNLSWVFTGGPRGGVGYDVRIDPQDNKIIWVTDSSSGAHQSTDGGVTWTAKNEGIDARTGSSGGAIPVFTLTIDQKNPKIIWAGVTGTRGLFKSIDGGETWVRKDNGIQDQPSMEMRGITIDPTDSNIVYCGGNYLANEATSDQRGFIYKSIDGGENWNLLIEPDALVRWIIIDPIDTSIIYASTGIFDRFAIKPTGVLKSTDGGQNWFQINNGFDNLAVAALAMDPSDHLTLIAGTGKSPEFLDDPNEIYGGVFITHDGGQNWKRVDPFNKINNYSVRFSAVAFAPSNPKIIYADSEAIFLRSEDGGETWTSYDVSPSLNNGLLETQGVPIALAVLPTDPDTIFMNAYAGGVFISRDGGKTWQDSSSGYSGATINSVAVDSASPAFVVTASQLGVFESFNSGATWQGRTSQPELTNLETVAVDPGDRNIILAGDLISGRMYRTNNGGFTWNLVLGPFGGSTLSERRAIHEIAFSPSAPKTVYAATGISSLELFEPRTDIGTGIFKSIDEGITWEPINTGLENTTLNFETVAVNPQNPDIVYLGELNSGVYKTQDGGKSWHPVNNGLLQTDIRSIAIDPTNPDTIYAGAEHGGLWKSENGGDSWNNSSSGLSAEASIRSIVIDPSSTNILYAADLQSGAFRSTDGGTLWKQINHGLKIKAIRSLAISKDGKTLYAATEGNGVYRMDLDSIAPEAQQEVTLKSFLGTEDSPITIDGSPVDWENRKVIGSDSEGDAEKGFIDFSDGYAFSTQKALYFLIKIVDPTASYIQFDILFTADGQNYLCSFGKNSSGCNLWNMTTNQDLGLTNFSKFSFGSALEGRIDLRDLGSHQNIQLKSINAMVGKCCESSAWRASDTWTAQGKTPSDDDSLVTQSSVTTTVVPTTVPTDNGVAKEKPSTGTRIYQGFTLPLVSGVVFILLIVGLLGIFKKRKGRKIEK